MYHLLLALWIAGCSWLVAASAAAACAAVDFAAMPLPQSDHRPEVQALLATYPDLILSQDGNAVSRDGKDWLPLGEDREITAKQALVDAAPLDQFLQAYPLGTSPASLAERRTPYFDPGRFRNAKLFEMLWFSSEAEARASLVGVPFTGLSGATVTVTSHRGVDCQLRAVIAGLQGASENVRAVFSAPGGGFNWRRISGTDRLSAHSYGIAIDLDPELGGYWRWSWAVEGRVGDYDNRIPPEVIDAFETYGFIWGGKWHHFDGMHFEYRPELILHSRISARMR
ncbi:M15 family metallopeptidase [Paracoccus sp. MBLB3053]|uniref:M15 family metallopeptidase n=1 Tax=Paracoccus aurantius TaxID=3073814 RepID=A0ABU2HTV7_9RHOB|nr:M15 family metallopeptidase [Paracoccus sp. MBLB3053]MDS9468488.1 M15 family metallopeptidase [Paracoccus sp. MBLB3053]